MLNRINTLFPLWAVLFSLIAYFFPAAFVGYQAAIVPLLSMIMFFMGLTLTFDSFKQVLVAPKPVIIGIALQFSIMPLLAFIISLVLALTADIAAGLILVGCCAGGTASNVICYLAKANVALSITMTMVSTLAAVVMTPLLSWVYIDAAIDINYLSMLVSILKMVIVPVLLGLLLNHYAGAAVTRLEPLLPTLSIVSIVAIIMIIVAVNENKLALLGPLIVVAVALHNGIGLLAAYGFSRALKLSVLESRTIAIEVSMQNSGLGVALALKYFSPLAALPAALFSIWHNIIGSLIAAYWAGKTPEPDIKQ